MRWRWTGVVLVLSVLRAAAGEAPAEAPPPGFSAGQYIDSRGCVFARQGDGPWQARLSRDGQPICGYPPTLAGLRMGADRLPAPPTDPRAVMTERLSTAIILGLNDGELVAMPGQSSPVPPKVAAGDPALDPAPAGSGHAAASAGHGGSGHVAAPAGHADAGHGAEPVNAPPPVIYVTSRHRTPPAPASGSGAKKDLGAELGQMMQASAGLRTAATAAALAAPRNGRLCNLLGPVGPGLRPMRSGPETMGFCALAPLEIGPAASAATARRPALAAASHHPKPGAAPATASRSAAEVVTSSRASSVGATTGRRTTAPSRKIAQPAPQGAGKTAATAKWPAAPGPALARVVMPSHRFVQAGTYARADNAARTAAQLAQMGLPVLHRTETQNGSPRHVIIAGPLGGREAVVRALAKLHAAGYRDAFSR